MNNRLVILFMTILLSFSLTNQALAEKQAWEFVPAEGHFDKRHEAAFVEIGGKFYALGGRKQEATGIYDPKTKRWTKGAAPPFNIHHFQPVIYKGRIYIIGAMTGNYPKELPIPNVMIYDPKQDSWIIGDEIPEARRRGGAGSVLYKGQIYFVSGITLGHWEGHVTWLDAYNPKTGEWTILPDAPRARDHFQAAIVDGKLYAAGGRRSSAKTKQTFQLTEPKVDVYDIKKRSWSTLASPRLDLPTERAGTSTTVIENHVVVLGGESGGDQKQAHDQVEAFDPKTSSWKNLKSLKRGRHGSGAFVYNGHVWTCCGSGNRGGGPELITIEKVKIDKSLFQ